MAVIGSAMYGLTLEKFLIDTAGFSLESETAVSCLMVLDAEAPNFDTHDFRADIAQEVADGSEYTDGGMTITGTELTVGSPAAGQIKYDSTDPAWVTSTIVDAMAGVLYNSGGSAATDQLIFLSDFVTAASSSNGTFTIQVAANGWFYMDYTP